MEPVKSRPFRRYRRDTPRQNAARQERIAERAIRTVIDLKGVQDATPVAQRDVCGRHPALFALHLLALARPRDP